ncbi:MAG TPA: coenzyme F420 hydrogenase subunit beta [Methanocorpusculum sp.]|jgi:coenzyme F420 hydrogenase subunit beta|nr:coenzyme F420 hydrogenase subunit beta [Methanocorpusculum sp.]MBR4285549.1 coenzyme F420 hydrogenase subunit beta [Methanocorpusculum sp.]MBR4987877.1 coenzyme F420 hydrogenase subunit beta [Methanocorpusculum sp.]MBR5008117.1 coenzyme F420 hydrogenase subunit beta [Methanocorpusculum sp.]MBR5450568.1 coenzyme F420 hydrogenase subunit beta [Methanocorpusculum sp.]
MSEYLGEYKAVYKAKSACGDILGKAQDGGIVTSMFAYALEAGIIDGAIVAGPGAEPYKPEPMIATTIEELLAARGTKYSISPNMSLIKEATRSYGLDKIGIVGTPCQIQAVRKAQLYPIGLRDVPDKIALAIGIFCMENFPYQGLYQMVEDHCATKIDNVTKMDIGKGKFTVYTERGAHAEIPLKVTHKYEQPACHVCLDYVANMADISTGSVGTPDGWSTVMVRSKAGEAAFQKAVDAGWIVAESMDGVKPGLELVEKLAKTKIDNNRAYLEHRKHEGTLLKPLRSPYI